MTKSKLLTRHEGDVSNDRSSLVKFDSVDSLRINLYGDVQTNQKNKLSNLVQAPLGFGRRSFAGGESERRRSIMSNKGPVQGTKWRGKELGRMSSSPRCSLDAHRRKSGTEMTATSPILASCRKGEWQKSTDWDDHLSIPPSWRSYASRRISGASRELQTASTDSDGSWPELGFWSTCKTREREELELLEFSHGDGSSFIDDGGWRPSSRMSSSWRWIGCLAELHRAASSWGRRRLKEVSGLGCGAGVLGRLDGLRPGKSFLSLFSDSILFSFSNF
jgi:hypothetical protein